MTARAIAVGIAAGAVVGVLVALLSPVRYRATTTLVIRANGVPAAVPTVTSLATSDVVVGNVADALHVSANTVRGRLHAAPVGRSALVRIRFDDEDASRARRVAQQAATVLQAIAGARLGSGIRVDVVDPARATRLGRSYLSDAAIGAAAGAVLAAAVLLLRRRPPERRPWRRARFARSSRADRHDLLGEVRAALAARADDYPEEQLLAWYACLGILAAEADDGRLSPALERVARDTFAPLLDRPA